MNQEKFIQLQHQIKHNQNDLQDVLKDLDNWSADMKKKETALQSQASSEKQNLPPVRNSLDKKKKKKVKKPTTTQDKDSKTTKKRINSYDYRSWDKFDVDKACEDADGKSESSEYETDEEWEINRKKQQASLYKDQGNQYFKEGKWAEAIECYTRGLECDLSNPLLPANRAMALLKQDKFGAAELDCTAAIALDPTYVKAYSRRGSARVSLNKHTLARDDYLKVLELEPNNKQAKTALEKIERVLNPPEILGSLDNVEVGIVKPIHKPVNKRSKKPLRRVPIEEIGVEEFEEHKRARERSHNAPSQTGTKQEVISADQAKFDQFLHPGHIGNGDVQTEEISDEREDEIQSKSGKSKAESSKDHTSSSAVTQAFQVPDVPANSFQFQTDWKVLCKRPTHDFYCYLQKIPVEDYVRLFGHALDADMLNKVFITLRQHYMSENKPIYPVLNRLPDVMRFSMTFMFLSSKDKQVVKELLEHISTNENCSKEDCDRLTKKYSL